MPDHATAEDMSKADIARIGLQDLSGDGAFDAFAHRIRARFDVDVALVTILDPDRDRQIFKGVSAPEVDWPHTRCTPLLQSLCKLVVAHAEPMAVNDVEAEIPQSVSTAYLHLGVLSYMGTPLYDKDGRAIGALCVGTSRALRRWRQREQDDLTLFAETVNEIIAHRQTAHRLDRTKNMLAAAQSAQKESRSMFHAMADNLPGCTLRYALFEDGTDAVEYLSDSCARVYGYSDDELQGDPARIWASILPEDREATLRSVLYSARHMTFWQQELRIKRPDGVIRRLRGYGQPAPMTTGVGVIWHSLFLDLDQVAEDAARHSPAPPVEPVAS